MTYGYVIDKLPDYLETVLNTKVDMCHGDVNKEFTKTVSVFPDGVTVTVEYNKELDTRDNCFTKRTSMTYGYVIDKLPDYLETVLNTKVDMCHGDVNKEFTKTVSVFPDGVTVTVEYNKELDTRDNK